MGGADAEPAVGRGRERIARGHPSYRFGPAEWTAAGDPWWNRPANARRGRSALVRRPGSASHTERMAWSAGIPVMVMPNDAKYSASIRLWGLPVAGKIMCRLMIMGSPWIVVM